MLTLPPEQSEALLQLAARVDRCRRPNNTLDVAVEIAAFKPDAVWAAIRANDACTKIILTDHHGSEKTFWADEWTRFPRASAIKLRSLALQPGGEK